MWVKYVLTRLVSLRVKYIFKLFAALAIGLAADSIEQFVIGFILPSTQQDLCLNEERSAWLGTLFIFHKLYRNYFHKRSENSLQIQ